MTTGISGTRLAPVALPAARDAEISPSQLEPWVNKYAEQYGADPMVMGAIIEQESSYVNHAVHRDGTGHGLIGLDDNGLLPDFERWSGMQVGRGARARTIPPEKQIEFLAKTIGELTQKFGDPWEAARAWHAGSGGRDSRNGLEYERLVKGRLANVVTWVAPSSGAEAPTAESTQPMYATNAFQDLPAKGPVQLDGGGGGAPVPGGIDLGTPT